MTLAPIPADIAERAEILVDTYRYIEDDREFVARILMAVGQGGGVPTRVGLTEQQSTVLTFVNQFQNARGFAPSYREIADGCDLASTSGVHRLIHGLVSRGALQMMAARGRSIAVVGRA